MTGGKTATGKLSTFAGVFTPSVLTILGIILFLRLGYVVGSAGLGKALIIIGIANTISVLTSVSLSAIATNIKVKGGGDYYLISRTLGVEFGGAIGIVLFLAQSVSIAFYCIGFGEAINGMLPRAGASTPQIIAAMAVAFLFIFAWLGADVATRFQYVVMALLGCALVSFFWGGLETWNADMVLRNWAASPGSPGFWAIFAIFFPAVTGFTQGVSMSGDLRDAGKSLPLGTFLAVGISIAVYFGVAVVFAGVLPNQALASDYGAMKKVARVEFLIHAGVIAATLSSAMASFLGAPRILQSLAGDRVFPFMLPFAEGFGPANNPRRGVLLSAGIAYTTIALGNLNVIAPVVSMFFLISYGLLNYATFYEARSASPSFRPRFRWFDHRLSLLGFLCCLGVMLAIDLAAGLVAISVLFAVFQYLKRTAGPARWADSRRSYHLQRVRENLLSAANEPEHARDWRPNLLAFSDDSTRRRQLLTFASWVQGNSGITTAVKFLEGEGLKALRLKEEAEMELKKDIADLGLNAFPLVVVSPNLQVGVQTLVQGFGVGPMKANMILLNWFEHLPAGVLGLKEVSYARNLRTAFRLGCNLVILNAEDAHWQALEPVSSGERRIDVWWWGDGSSRLMLLLAYLITRNEAWEEAKIRVLAAGYGEKNEETEAELKRTLEETRISSESEIVEEATSARMAEYSADAALMFVPFRFRGNKILDPFGGQLDDFLKHFPVTALVLAAEDIDLDAEPEEGKAGEMAEALDALSEAEKRARDTRKEAEKAVETLEEKRKAWQDEVRTGADAEALAHAEGALREAEDQAMKAARRAARAEAKAEDAARRAETMGVTLPREEDRASTDE